MAHYTGKTGAIYAPTGTTDLAAVTFAQLGVTNFYTIQTEATRILRAFTAASVIGDFSPAAGSMVDLIRPTGTCKISGAGATVAVTSSNSRVYTMAKIAGFHEFTIQTDAELIPVTELGDEYDQFEKAVVGFSAVGRRHWQDENFSLDAAATLLDIDDGKFVVEFFVDVTAGTVQRYVGSVQIAEYSLAGARSGAVAEATVNMMGEGQLYYRTLGN